MPVTIGEVSSEFTIDPAQRSGAADSGAPAPAPEVKLEELRNIVRELLIEEMERYLRVAVER